MKIKYSFNILIIFTVLFFSCKTTKIVKHDDSNALLWKIESETLAQPSYLFGTIHIIDSANYFLPNGFYNAIDASKEVVFEIDMNEMEDPSKVFEILPKIMMKNDTSLKDLLTEEEYKIVEKKLSSKGLPIFMLEKIKPMFLTVIADMDLQPNALKTGVYLSYETEISKLAQEKNISVSGLETIDYQISIFDSIPYNAQAEMLVKSMSKKHDSSNLDYIIKLYKNQDIEEMYKMIKTEETTYKYEKYLLTNRNKNWIPIIEDKIANRATLFAVGAGHLGGKTGVINLLKNKGYSLTPVK